MTRCKCGTWADMPCRGDTLKIRRPGRGGCSQSAPWVLRECQHGCRCFRSKKLRTKEYTIDADRVHPRTYLVGRSHGVVQLPTSLASQPMIRSSRPPTWQLQAQRVTGETLPICAGRSHRWRAERPGASGPHRSGRWWRLTAASVSTAASPRQRGWLANTAPWASAAAPMILSQPYEALSSGMAATLSTQRLDWRR